MAHYREYGLDVRIQRTFNIYGPRIREYRQYGRVIPGFIVQPLKNEPVTVYEDIIQTRAFLYITDWLEATWKFLKGKYKGEIINIGYDKEISIIDLAKKIISWTGSKSGIVFLPRRQDDPTRRAADIRKAKELLNWEQKIDLDESLKKTIDWFRVRL